MSQGELVSAFYDGHAADYRKKYKSRNPFYDYFFYERLRVATKDIDLGGKRIVDIGAGTGGLYDYLQDEQLSVADYLAIDTSAGMLANSNIPRDRQIVGDLEDIDCKGEFDIAFLLGVTTYVSKEKMQRYISCINELLAPGGVLVITFTNSRSLDILFRSIFSPIFKMLPRRGRIISQKFKTYYYSRKEAMLLLEPDFETFDWTGINHTIFPVSRLVPRLSLRWAERVGKMTAGPFKTWMSGDLLIKATKR